jgi:hypothetical protein
MWILHQSKLKKVGFDQPEEDAQKATFSNFFSLSGTRVFRKGEIGAAASQTCLELE